MTKVVRRLGIFGLTSLVLFGAFVAPSVVAAQNPPAAAPWMQMTLVEVDPAMVDEYVLLQRDITARLRRAQGATWRIVTRNDVFGNAFQFMILTPVQNLGGFDQTRTADAELAALASRAQKYIKSQQSLGIRAIPEIDNPLPERQAPAVLVVNIARVTPGRDADYMALMKSEFLPHFNKAEFRHVNGILTFGGASGFIHIFYAQNYGKLDEGSPIVRALGPDAAQKVTAKFAGIVTSTELWVARVVPDLSFGPWSPAQSRQ